MQRLVVYDPALWMWTIQCYIAWQGAGVKFPEKNYICDHLNDPIAAGRFKDICTVINVVIVSDFANVFVAGMRALRCVSSRF